MESNVGAIFFHSFRKNGIVMALFLEGDVFSAPNAVKVLLPIGCERIHALSNTLSSLCYIQEI